MTHLEAIARILNPVAFDDSTADANSMADAAWQEKVREHTRTKARAILTAIRDPTPTMLKAGADATDPPDDCCVENIWVSMIDAALAETST